MTLLDGDVALHPHPTHPSADAGRGPFRRATAAMLLLATGTVGWQNAVVLPVPALPKVVGVLAGLLGLLTVMVEGARPRLRDAHHLAVALAACVILSIFWTLDQSLTLSAIVATVLLVGLFILTGEFLPGRRGALQLATAYCAGTLVSVLLLVVRRMNGTAVTVDNRDRLGELQPNDLAFMLCLSIPLAWYVGRSRGRLWLVAAYAYIPLALFAIVLGASRSGLVLGLLAAAVVPWTVLAGRPGRAAAVGIVLLVVGPLALPLLPAEQVSRLATTSSELGSGDLNNRSVLWSAAWKTVGDHPLQGVGAGASRVAIEQRTDIYLGAHNTFLSVTAELGVLGLTCFMLLIFCLAGRVVRLPSSLERRTLVVLGVVVLLGLQVRHWEYEKALWVIFAFILSATEPDKAGTEAEVQT